jgi:aminoglycoside N3'-acetyltransferase
MTLAECDGAFFDDHFSALGFRRGMEVLVHSRLVSFGRIAGGAPTIYEALRRAIGEEATIAVPTYTFQLGPEDVFDPAKTPSVGFGAFSEWVRQHPKTLRGICPVHGTSANGPKADAVANADETKSVGPGSSFDAMYQSNFQLLLLGCSFQQGATFVHHVEAEVGVPYRQWLELPRQVCTSDGGARQISVRYYGRVKESPWHPHLHDLQKSMIEEGQVTTTPAPYGQSIFVPLETLFQSTAAFIKENPFGIVSRTTD